MVALGSMSGHHTNAGRIVEQLLLNPNGEYIMSYERSQYSEAGGASSCGLAALNCARIVLGKEKAGIRERQLLYTILQPEMFEEVLGLCASWSSDAHLDVEDIYQTPAFHRTLHMLSAEYGMPSVDHFKKLLNTLEQTTQRRSCSSCTVITRPPEIISCFCIYTPRRNIFVIFDSHPRPDMHPDGAAFVCYSSAERAAEYLSTLLHFDQSIISEHNVQWQAQLLENFSGNVFVARDAPTTDSWIAATLDASLQVLHFRAECLQMRARVRQLAEEKEKSERDLQRCREELEAQRTTPVSGTTANAAYRRNSVDGSERNSFRITVPNWLPFRSYGDPAADFQQGSSRTSNGPSNAPRRRSSNPRASHPPPTRTPPVPKKPFADTYHSDFALALEAQHLFDEENIRILDERARLSNVVPSTFQCGVCLESFVQDFLAEVAACKHRFCRDCLQEHVRTDIDTLRFPIVCPLCKADRHCQKLTILDNSFIQQVGLSEDQYIRFVEMEMSAFATSVECRSCHNTFLVDKDEYADSKVISCPLPRCESSWCKLCNQMIENDGPEHSCNGTNELNHLMGRKGWKYCPGCQTPAEKTEGCNHMACTSPGCNTHFCYLCGKLIVHSIVAREINVAVSDHYSHCQMFDDVEEV